MTIAEFTKLLDDGLRPVIEFKESESHVDSYADPGMRARATGWLLECDDVVIITVDFSEFEQFNLQFEKPDYYDKAGHACLTAHQAGYYRPTDHYYYGLNDPMESHFVIVEDFSLKLYGEYRKANAGRSYIAWLEERLTGVLRTCGWV